MKFRTSLLLASLLLSVSVSASAQQPPAGVGPNYETRLAALEDEIRAMNGQLEQAQFGVHRLDQDLQKLQADYDSRLSRLEQQLAQQQQRADAAASAPPPAPSVVVPPQPVEPVNGALGELKTHNGATTAVNNPKTPPLPEAPADYGLTPQEQYDRAFGLLRQANYDEAEKAFKSFIDKNPKEKLIDNAKYWYGETLYVRGRFDEFAVAFADAYQQNPQGSKAADSLLKLSMSLGALNKTADACTTLMELKTKYPAASATVRSRADEERAKMKCPAH